MLQERSSDEALSAALASASACDAFWKPHYQAMAGMSEHSIAVRLAYLLVAQARGLNLDLAAQPGDAAVTTIRARLEDMAVLPFEAFD
jgi:hypothetical protein